MGGQGRDLGGGFGARAAMGRDLRGGFGVTLPFRHPPVVLIVLS